MCYKGTELKNTQSFGSWLKAAREESGVSQGALAEALGVKQPIISRMENGLKSKITRSEAASIAKVLGVPTSEVEAAAGINNRLALIDTSQLPATIAEDVAFISSLTPEEYAEIVAPMFAALRRALESRG
jgi:transcriptional regulator with XRE-family HTH domain